MKSLLSKKTVSYLIFMSLCGFLAILVFLLNQSGQTEPDNDISQVEKNSHAQLSMHGMTFSNYEADKLLTKIKVGSFEIIPKRVFIFKLNKLNEIRIDTFECDDYTSFPSGNGVKGNVFTFKRMLPTDTNQESFKQFGLIKEGSIKNLSINFHDAHHVRLKVTASQAEIDFKSNRAVFHNLILEQPHSGKKIYTNKSTWDAASLSFLIPGPYKATSPKGQGSGKGIAVDLNFKVRKI